MEKNRLAEALKKHQLLVEYNFYLPSGMDEQEETAPPADLPGGETLSPEAPAEPTGEPASPEPTPEVPTSEPTPIEPTPNEKGEVELDITDLVNSTKDTKDKIDGINELLNNLMGKFDEFETKMGSFDQILDKINSLEKDIDKRIPTPTEKLEMRSMDSFPYSVKLTDYWKEETENMEGSDDEQGGEHVLTPEDIKKDYNASTIKTSFDIQKFEDQDFNI